MTDLEPGNLIEAAWWIWDGGWSEKDAREIVQRVLHEQFEEAGWAHSPPRILIADPTHHRLPDPPEHIHNRNPRAVVGQAEAVAPLSVTPLDEELTKEDHEKLRDIVRKRWSYAHGGERLGNEACDAVIEQLTPSTVRALIQ